MKLRYFRAQNILSFGEEVVIEFGPFNTIVGPNDSGKTNLFRGINLMKDALDFGKIHLDEFCNNGNNDKCSRLEIDLELEPTELELVSKLIICSEMVRMSRDRHDDQDDVWKLILLKYGYRVLIKSLKHLCFILKNDDVRPSEPKIFIQLAKNPNLFLDQSSEILTTEDRTSISQIKRLGDIILENFQCHFASPLKKEALLIIKDERKVEQAPSLSELLEEMHSTPSRAINLPGGELYEYQHILKGAPILRELALLFDLKGLDKEKLYLWTVLKQLFVSSFIDLNEIRDSKDTKNTEYSNIFGSSLAKDLFRLTSSGTRKNREKYANIHRNFRELTGAEFDIVFNQKEIDIVTNGQIGIFSDKPNSEGFAPLTINKEKQKQIINEAFIQIVKDNYPISIERSASGLYEILLVLTKVIGETEKVLLLDEPELHLHPSMQKRILNLLVRYGKEEKNQIILITHSPYLISIAQIEKTWRFTTQNGTIAHNIGSVLTNLKTYEKGKFIQSLSLADVRSLLFSRGVILVEGPSDRIAIDQVDKFLSTKGLGANIDENEWPILDIAGKSNLFSSIKLCQMLNLPYFAILDNDALMHKDSSIEVNTKRIKTSVILSTLKQLYQIENTQVTSDLLSDTSNGDYYEPAMFESLQKLALTYHIFALPDDLENAMGLPKKARKGKPLQALERIIELIREDKLPEEFRNIFKFLKQEVQKTAIYGN